MGRPRKTRFKVTADEISLGDFVVPASEVHSCKVGYPKKWLGPLSLIIGLSFMLWFLYELMSLIIRLVAAMSVDPTSDGVDSEVKLATVRLLNKFYLRSSTSDDQQLALTFWIYIFSIAYGLFIAPLIFRPRIVLVARGGNVVEVAYRFVRPRKLAKTLVAARILAKRTKVNLRQSPSE